MKDIDTEIKRTFGLSNAEEIINESEKLIKSFNELIEKIKEIKKIECSVYIKMEKFLTLISDMIQTKLLKELENTKNYY